MPSPSWRRSRSASRGVEADDVLDLLLDALGIGRGQVDLVEDRDDLEVVVEREVDVGEGLRLDALRRVDDEQRALAGGEAARHLVVKSTWPGVSMRLSVGLPSLAL
jgi:hypothetical protein